MSDVAARSHPMRSVLAEQFRMVGLSIRAEALMVAVLVAFISIGMLMAIWREGLVMPLRTDNHPLFAVLGALLPFAVWKGRGRLHEGAFLVMPVEHRLHALTRVLAGWFWLVAAVAALLLWQALLALISGGDFGITATRHVADGVVHLGTPVSESQLHEVSWSTPAWQWLMPFTGATVVYALFSALNLGTRHPLRVVGAVLIALLLLGLATGEYVFEWLRIVLDSAFNHPWGLDTVVTGGSESLKTQVAVVGRNPTLTTVWRELPTFGVWVNATLLWLAIAAAALWAATRRLRER